MCRAKGPTAREWFRRVRPRLEGASQAQPPRRRVDGVCSRANSSDAFDALQAFDAFDAHDETAYFRSRIVLKPSMTTWTRRGRCFRFRETT